MCRAELGSLIITVEELGEQVTEMENSSAKQDLFDPAAFKTLETQVEMVERGVRGCGADQQ